jgi:hypothetical protein
MMGNRQSVGEYSQIDRDIHRQLMTVGLILDEFLR